ncbi:MAG: hypothetical protein NTNFB01_10360 [Nitrospira sp.]
MKGVHNGNQHGRQSNPYSAARKECHGKSDDKGIHLTTDAEVFGDEQFTKKAKALAQKSNSDQ